jgi:Na+/glutamate symporter
MGSTIMACCLLPFFLDFDFPNAGTVAAAAAAVGAVGGGVGSGVAVRTTWQKPKELSKTMPSQEEGRQLQKEKMAPHEICHSQPCHPHPYLLLLLLLLLCCLRLR